MLTSDNKTFQGVEILPKNPEKRPVVTNETTHIEYFEELMFDRVNMCSLSKIESLNIAIRFDIVGHNAGSWTIVVEDGALKRMLRNYVESSTFEETSGLTSNEVVLKPACTFLLDGKTFMSIIRREFTPQQAFFEKKVQIEGDVTLALKMNVLVNYM